MAGLLEGVLKVATPDELVQRLYPNGRLGGLAVGGKAPGALGKLIRLRVEVAEPEREFLINGQLAWVRHKEGPNQPMGYGVDFLPEENATRLRLLSFARKEIAPDATRAEDRHHVNLRVTLSHEGTLSKELLMDLSLRGAFVGSAHPLPIGAKVRLYFRPPLTFSTFELKGQVVWVRHDKDTPGMGVEFEPNETMRHKIQKILPKLSR